MHVCSHHRGKPAHFPLPDPPAFSVLQPDSWFSIDTAGGRGVLVAAEPGREEAAGSRRAAGGLRQADHARRTPHLDGRVIAGGQQQLLVGGTERHRVHHVVVRQARQADVVVAVPDVAVLVFSATAGSGEEEQVSKAFAVKSFQHCT